MSPPVKAAGRRRRAPASPAVVASAVVASAVAASAAAHPVRAAELRLAGETYASTVLDQDLKVTLREFGANLGVRMAVGEAVQGRVRGRLPVLPPVEFLTRLGESYGFDWYYDGYAVHVSASSEGLTHILSLEGVSYDRLRESLDALGVSDPRYVVRPHAQPEVVLVAGPPRFVELVERTVSVLMAKARPPEAARGPGAPGPATTPEAARPRPPVTVMIYRAGDVRRQAFEAE